MSILRSEVAVVRVDGLTHNGKNVVQGVGGDQRSGSIASSK